MYMSIIVRGACDGWQGDEGTPGGCLHGQYMGIERTGSGEHRKKERCVPGWRKCCVVGRSYTHHVTHTTGIGSSARTGSSVRRGSMDHKEVTSSASR